MFCIRRPTESKIADYLGRQAEQPCSYDSVGCIRDVPAPRRGWNVDRERVLLGNGRPVFDCAKAAIDGWRMFPSKIATVHSATAPREGLNVAVLYHAAPLPIWILMAARVTAVFHETEPADQKLVERYGFAYRTLPDHPERGEERFLVEWNHADDSVWYDLLAVSQPAHWIARLGYPYTRHEQARFRRLSCAAMLNAVK